MLSEVSLAVTSDVIFNDSDLTITITIINLFHSPFKGIGSRYKPIIS